MMIGTIALPEIIAIIAIVLITGFALFYTIRAKKRGQKCIGCPHSKTCGSNKKENHSCCECCNCKTKE